MLCKSLFRRFSLLFALLLLLTIGVCAEAPAQYTMRLHEGRICVQEAATGEWIYCSDVCGSMLSQRDQLLLENGIALHDRAEFTSAIEDFCS